MLQEELTETTTEDKLRRLTSFFTSKSFEDIDMSFNLHDDINVDRDYFLEMMAGALHSHTTLESTLTPPRWRASRLCKTLTITYQSRQ
ncbi:hypothetical protein OSTOST_23972 [Ostertagia ostertagi]